MEKDIIYIIGAGAIGKALAVFLHHAGKEVVLLRGRDENGPRCREDIHVETGSDIISEKIHFDAINNYETLNGVIVLTNKSYGNEDIAAKLKSRIGNSPLVILQNGLHIEDVFIDQDFHFIYRAVLFATSQPLPGNQTRFKPVNTSPVGVIKGDETQLSGIIKQLNNPYFPFRAERNLEPILWTKVIVNTVFNSVCPLLETDNGIFQRDPMSLRIAERIIAECVKIAMLSGVELDPGKVVSTLLQISHSSDGQFISTYQDIKNKRRTEIGTLNFAIVNIANKLGSGDGVTETKLLGELVEIKSGLYQNT